MKKKINTQNYFRKMLIMCLLAVSCTMIILSLFFYQKYTEALSKKLYADQEKSLEKSAQTMSDVYSEISQLYNTVILDSKVVAFSSLTNFNPTQNYATYLIVKKFYNINPYVNSLYIYNDMSQDAITCGSYRFDLEQCWNQLKETKTACVFPSALIGTDKTVLTFAYPMYAENYDQLSGGIFINLDMEKLQSHVLGSSPENGMIFDYSGLLLLSNGAAPSFLGRETLTSVQEHAEIPPADAQGMAYTQIMEDNGKWHQPSKNSAGSCKVKVEGEHYLVSYYKDTVRNLTFLCYSPYSQLVSPMKHQRNLYLGVAGLIFCSGIILQYFITRQLYRPLEEITTELRGSKFGDMPDMDEFSLIRHVYEKALDEIEVLEQEHAVYQPRLKSDLLKGLLLGNRDISEIKEQLTKNNWDIPFDGMFLSSLFIDRGKESELLSPIIQTGIQQLFYEKLKDMLYIECVSIGSDQVVCLINTSQNSALTFDGLVDLLKEIRDQLLTSYHITVTIGLDGMIRRMEDCFPIYHHVLELANYRFVLGDNQIIYQKRILELFPECMTYPDQLASEIITCMLHGKEEEFLTDTGEFLTILKQYTYQPASLLYNRLYLDMLFHMQKLNMPGKETSLTSEPLRFPDTLEEGSTILKSMYHQYQERKHAAEQLKDNKHFERIEESKRYIAIHYNDYNLSAGMVAEYLGYSTNYFSRIFKTITGFYINDYIRQIRIVKAQELLTQSDMTVTNIAEAIGFSNPNYFYAFFKKETGLTPAAYRNAGQNEPPC